VPRAGAARAPGKTGGGGSGASEFGWYYEMLHDRFHTRWQQPTSIVRSDQDFVTTLKIRIAKDGSISGREIVTTSGNQLMDASVLAAAEQVAMVEPLPAGLGTGEAFEIKINFKLDRPLKPVVRAAMRAKSSVFDAHPGR
jgi:TonB family protein